MTWGRLVGPAVGGTPSHALGNGGLPDDFSSSRNSQFKDLAGPAPFNDWQSPPPRGEVQFNDMQVVGANIWTMGPAVFLTTPNSPHARAQHSLTT